jgi:hypothetical protein
MKKYINSKGTFVAKRVWISANSEAKILGTKGDEVEILLKDLSNPITLSSSQFFGNFVEAGDITTDDEFEFHSSVNKISQTEITKLIDKFFVGEEQKLFRVAVEKAATDAYSSGGSTKSLNISKYLDFTRGLLKKAVLEDIGDPIFNRRSRWSPIADVANWKSRGYPAPIGIRASDYARLRECNQIYMELLTQIFSMSYESPLPQEIAKYLQYAPSKGTHKCLYCGISVSLSEFADQQYKAKIHALNFCHRDPGETLGRTRPGNVYFGHTTCNRTQGGLSELDRILDGLRLLNLHQAEYESNPKVIEALKKVL